MAGSTLTYKKVRETEKELAHTNVFYNGSYIGYYLPNNSPASRVDENWNFVSKKSGIKCHDTKTQKEMKLWLKNIT